MRLKKTVFILALIVFLGALGYLGTVYFSYWKAQREYDRLAQEVVSAGRGDGQDTGKTNGEAEDENGAWAPLEVDFNALYAVCPDVVLWLDIPGTGISYPVVQSEDNDYYLRRNLEGKRSSAGTVFMDFRNDPALGDDNTILYGHNMRNGSMFGTLRKYTEEEFFRGHQEIDLYLPDRIVRCQVASSRREDAVEEYFQPVFTSAEEKLSYVNRMKEKAYYDTGVEMGTEDRIITLVTCTGNGYSQRWIVQAKIAEEIMLGSDGEEAGLDGEAEGNKDVS